MEVKRGTEKKREIRGRGSSFNDRVQKGGGGSEILIFADALCV